MPITLKLNLSSTSIKVPVPTTHDDVSRPALPAASNQTVPDDGVISGAPAASSSATSTSTPKFKVKATPSSSSSKKPTPKSKLSAKKSKSKTNPKPRPSSSTPRPTAIPPRLFSAGPSTPRAGSSSLPEDGSPYSSTSGTSPVKSEPTDEYAPYEERGGLTPKMEDGEGEWGIGQEIHMDPLTPLPEVVASPTPEIKEKAPPKWQRAKKPLKELLNKVMVELRRRDEYALFEEPVNTEDFPDYLGIIGGEENMMDLATMQTKVDEGVYRTMDSLEADLRKLVTAAQTFNLPGTIPHNSAGRVLQYGLKIIERSRPLVRTPSPSPVRESATPAPGRSAYSTREGTVPLTAAMVEIPPNHAIPVEMLKYPPGSLIGHAVGWNVNGGRHIWTKRQIRGRERFSGKWRHSGLDGTRELSELEDPDDWLGFGRSDRGPYSSEQIDWRRVTQPNWWEVDLGGPTGLAPLPFTPYPKPSPLNTHNITASYNWGAYPRVDDSTTVERIRTKKDPDVALADGVRPEKTARVPLSLEYANADNIFGGHLDVHPSAVMEALMFGDTTGEAYQQSLRHFVKGAMEMAGASDTAADDKVKEEEESDKLGLDEWVEQNWRCGIASSRFKEVYDKTVSEVSAVARQSQRGMMLDARQRKIKDIATTEYQRRALQYMTALHRQLDISSLLKNVEDFKYEGVGGRTDIVAGLGLCAKEIVRLSSESSKKRKRDEDVTKDENERYPTKELLSTTSSPLSQPPGSPQEAPKQNEEVGNTEDRKKSLEQLRLELSASSKFYPLSALKKLSKEDAERLLPLHVRPLLTVKEEGGVKV